MSAFHILHFNTPHTRRPKDPKKNHRHFNAIVTSSEIFLSYRYGTRGLYVNDSYSVNIAFRSNYWRLSKNNNEIFLKISRKICIVAFVLDKYLLTYILLHTYMY